MDSTYGFRISPILYIVTTSKSSELVLQGGTNSGKTYSVLLGLILDLLRNVGYVDSSGEFVNELIIVYTTDLTEAKKTGVMYMFMGILSKYNLWKYVVGGATRGLRVRENKIVFESGGEIVFSSTAVKDTARKSKPTQAFFNEVNFCSAEFYSDVHIRTYKRVISDFNSDEEFWLHKRINSDRCGKYVNGVCVEYRDRKDWQIEYHIFNYTHNIELSPPYVDKKGRFIKKCDIIDAGIKSKLLEMKRKCESGGSERDCRQWYVLGLGKTGSVAGNVYNDYEWIDEEEFENAWRYGENQGFGSDYGYVIQGDPFVLTKNVIYQGDVYSKILVYDYHLKREHIALLFNEHEVGNYPIVFDNSHVKETFDYLYDSGFNMIAAQRLPYSILNGINLLSQSKLYLVEDNNYRHEIDKYKWRKKHGEYTRKINPVDKHNHALDSLRYWRLHIEGDSVTSRPTENLGLSKPIII